MITDFRLVPSSKHRGHELHCVERVAGAVVACYIRFRAGRWERRGGFGEVWEPCDRPADGISADVLDRLEGETWSPA